MLVQLLAMFGLMLMVLVTVVSLVITWNSEDEEFYIVGLPMFQPLMWIAVGIFTGRFHSLADLKTREVCAVLTGGFAVDCSCQHGTFHALVQD